MVYLCMPSSTSLNIIAAVGDCCDLVKQAGHNAWLIRGGAVMGRSCQILHASHDTATAPAYLLTLNSVPRHHVERCSLFTIS